MPQPSVGHAAVWKWIAAFVIAVVLTTGFVQPTQTALALSSSLGDGSAKLSLPWARGEFWRLTGGPHPESYGRQRPWSSVDFQPENAKPGRVRAARGGVVSRPCRNLVLINHGDGWTTSYYHVTNIQVKNGQRVDRGQLLGWTSTRAGCGGFATGPHLHFSLLWKGDYVNIRGHAVGGWKVTEGSEPYRGCLVKDGMRKCAPKGNVYNFGVIGAT
jgi:LasA protease